MFYGKYSVGFLVVVRRGCALGGGGGRWVGSLFSLFLYFLGVSVVLVVFI